MNGFANSILSILLSWIRALVANIWVIINSEDGGTVYRFFAANWLRLLVFLLVFGYIADRIIYLIRWRPYYVWLSRLDRLRGRKKTSETESIPIDSSEPVPDIAVPATVYQSSPFPMNAYAPAKQTSSRLPESNAMAYASPADEPLYDEPVAEWDEDASWQAEPEIRPERTASMDYYRDMEAGYAPAVPPEQLYAPRIRSVAQAAPAAPVHPGLDAETFRQTAGLEDQPPSEPVPVVRAPAFKPFTVREETEPVQPQSALSRLARRARSLMGTSDENQLSFRDLHSTVDVSKAFHDPVYPQSMKIDE